MKFKKGDLVVYEPPPPEPIEIEEPSVGLFQPSAGLAAFTIFNVLGFIDYPKKGELGIVLSLEEKGIEIYWQGIKRKVFVAKEDVKYAQ